MNGNKISGAEAIIKSFLSEGVDTVFGYPGGAIIPVYDVLYGYKKELRHILVRHEQAAIHAAQGYARVTGRTGVAMVTSGPGATNIITGITDALIDSTPLVVITGQVGNSGLGTDAFQETDVMGITCDKMELPGAPCRGHPRSHSTRLPHRVDRASGSSCARHHQRRTGAHNGMAL